MTTTPLVPLTPINIPPTCLGLGDVLNVTEYVKTACYLAGPNNSSDGGTYADAAASCASIGARLYMADSVLAIQTLENLLNAKFGSNSAQFYIWGTDGQGLCAVSYTTSSQINMTATDCTTPRGYVCEFIKIGKHNWFSYFNNFQ